MKEIYCKTGNQQAIEDIRKALNEDGLVEVHNTHETFYGHGWLTWLKQNFDYYVEVKDFDKYEGFASVVVMKNLEFIADMRELYKVATGAKEKFNEAIIFVNDEKNNGYACFDDDAKVVAEGGELELHQLENHSWCRFSDRDLNIILPMMIRSGHRVVIAH
jgi:hypothetical protein